MIRRIALLTLLGLGAAAPGQAHAAVTSSCSMDRTTATVTLSGPQTVDVVVQPNDGLTPGTVTTTPSGGSPSTTVCFGLTAVSVTTATGDTGADVVTLNGLAPANGGHLDVRSTLGAGSDQLTFTGAADTLASTDDAGDDQLTVTGDVGQLTAVTGTGNDTVTVAHLAPTTDPASTISMGNDPNDHLSFAPVSDPVVSNATGVSVGRYSIAGVRWITGGSGDDDITLPVDGGIRLEGGAGDDDLTGGPLGDVILGGDGDDDLIGMSGNDGIIGGNGDDLIDGGLGADMMTGGAGTDTITYANRTGFVLANLNTNKGGESNENDTYVSCEALIGGSGADTLTGSNVLGDTLVGGPGDDYLYGNGGDDKLYGQEGNDAINPGPGGSDSINDGGPGANGLFEEGPTPFAIDLVAGTLSIPRGNPNLQQVANVQAVNGGSGDDLLVGDDGPNSFLGLDGNDTIIGGGGNDIMDGGTGRNTASYADHDATQPVVASLVTRTGGTTGESDTLTNFQSLVGTPGNDTLTGDVASNTLLGGDGDDMLDGGLGDDVLDGQDGSDTLSYASRTSAQPLKLSFTGGGGSGETDQIAGFERIIGGAGNDTMSAAGDPAGIELDGGGGNDALTGGDGPDVVRGDAGDDTIDGGDAADVLDGGAGRNTLSFASDLDDGGVTVDLAQGLAQANNGPKDAITAFQDVTGSDGDDTLTGTGAANTLQGGDGADTINGAGGDDVVLGGNDDDVLGGGDGADQLDGGKDDDVLVGAAGADSLSGGTGTDTVDYSSSTGAVSVSLDGAANDGTSGEGDQVVGVEDVVGSSQDDVLTGNQADNALDGGGGNDLLLGGLGDDVLTGGAGTDTASYADHDAGAPITADLGTGRATGPGDEQDRLTSIEALRGGTGADTLTAAPDGNPLDGGPGDDRLVGGDGPDVLTGSDGNDTLTGAGGDDVLSGGSGDDALTGGAGTDRFDAGAGDDTLAAFDGIAETVDCGAGTDTAERDASDTLTSCETSRVPGSDELPPDVRPPTPPLPPRDRDGDGLSGAQDCDDTDPTIGVGKPDPPGDGIDQDCDGKDSSYPMIASRVTTSFARVRNRGLRVKKASVSDVPAGATITVTCVASGKPRCPFGRRVRQVPVAKKAYDLRGIFGDNLLSTKAKLTITVQAPAVTGRVTTLKLTKLGKSTRTDMCLPVGATKAVTC